jgi:3-deoxy-7-phosphoheptulonate synthase
VVKGLSHLPIIVDPSRTRRPDLIPLCALAGASGRTGSTLKFTVPGKAKSDGPQALLPKQYAELMVQIRKLAELFGKKISETPGKKST